GIVPGADVQLGTHLRLPEGAELLSDAEPRGARAPAEPDVEEGVSRAIRVGPGIDRDAVISAGDQPTVPVVDPGMGVLVIAGATSLAIAAGIASVIGETEREPMVPAEPDVVRAPLPEDPVDRAQLLTARGLAADHSRSAEDVVVRHADSGSSEHDPIRIAALVDARVGAAVIRTVPVPLVLAAFLALVADERARARSARDADRRRRRKARTRRRGRAVRQVSVRMKPVGDGELLEAPAAGGPASTPASVPAWTPASAGEMISFDPPLPQATATAIAAAAPAAAMYQRMLRPPVDGDGARVAVVCLESDQHAPGGAVAR